MEGEPEPTSGIISAAVQFIATLPEGRLVTLYVHHRRAEEMDQVFQQLELDEQSYIVAVTRGHQHDQVVIERAIHYPVRYIGMLGSERKKMLMWKSLEKSGIPREQLDAVYSPIGFNIGADTPEEIAVSVVGELIKVRRGTRKFWKTKTMETAF